MSKRIISKSERWPGSVTIADPLTLPQVELIEQAFELPEGAGDKQGRVYFTVLDKPALPAILACVEKWDLQNFPNPPTAETFPFSPRGDSHKLIEWLFGEIQKVYNGEQEIPNE